MNGVEALRALAERLARNAVFPRRLPAEFARVRMLVSSEGGLRYLLRPMAEVDPVLLRLAARCVQPGDDVWDVGANVGLFAFAAGARAGPLGTVLALEPDTVLVNLLRRSARRLPETAASVEVLAVAASSEAGVSRLNIGRRSRSTNFLDGYGSTQTGGARSANLVPTVTLDSLLDHFPAPAVLKIDVEGAEEAVLVGASRVLHEAKPLLICEVVPGATADRVTDTLHGAGYVLFDGEADGFACSPADQATYTTVAVHDSQRHRLRR